MNENAFTLELHTRTPVLLNRWLMLDAILDGMMEADRIPPDQRKLPLLAWDGKNFHENLTAEAVQSQGWVFCASATLPSSSIIEVDHSPIKEVAPRAVVPATGTRSVAFRAGTNPMTDFNDGQYPFKQMLKWDQKSGPTAGVLSYQRQLQPGRFRWHFQGNPEGILSILANAVGIGAKTRNGWGEINHDLTSVIPASTDHLLWGIVGYHEEGNEPELMRPAPMALFDESNLPFPAVACRRMETCAPPYWRKENAVPAFSPVTMQDSLLDPA